MSSSSESDNEQTENQPGLNGENDSDNETTNVQANGSSDKEMTWEELVCFTQRLLIVSN